LWLGGSSLPPFFPLRVMQKQFYETILPQQGIYCVAGISKSGVKQRFAESIDELLSHIQFFNNAGVNVYVAPNSFKGHSRKAEFAVYSRSLFIDLDVNHGSVCYTSKQEALDALTKFCEDVGLPLPTRLDSGTGIQAYWAFNKDIEISEWKGYADKFRQFCIDKGLKIDPSVTADVARIMRCPNTFNYKTDPPNPTSLIDTQIEVYDFNDLKEFLGEIPKEANPLDILAAVPKGQIEEIDGQYLKSSFEVLAQRSIDDEGGCKQIKFILENAHNLDYNLWRGVLSIAINCIDGETAIHEVSNEDPRYDREQTITKANDLLGKPFKCITFEKFNPGGCAGCPHLGRVTNPLALGQIVEEAPSAEDSVRSEEEFVFPAFMKPFSRHIQGGIYYTPPMEKDEDGNKIQPPPIRLTAHDVYPIARAYNKTDGASLLMRHVLPKDPEKEFTLNFSSLVSMDEFRKIMARHDVVISPKNAPLMYHYIEKWIEYYQNLKEADMMRMQMGWTEDYDAFVFGSTEITKNSVQRNAVTSPMIRNASRLVRPFGDYGIWKQCINMLDLPGYQIQAFGLLLGFGSPLMRRTSTAGSVVNFLNSDTGAGKTAALYSGLSVFSDPYNSSLIEGGATANAMIGRYLAMKNIMLGMDELGNFDPTELSRLVHMISQGKAKLRLQSSVNAERELEMGASLIVGATSNQSLHSKFFEKKSRPDGELARMLQFTVTKPPLMAQDPVKYGIQIFDPLRTNYGHAGPDFIKYCFSVGDSHVRKAMDKRMNQFTKDFGGDSAYRFYINTVTSCTAGGDLAKEADIIGLNIDKIYDKITEDLIDQRNKSMKLNTPDYRGLFSLFMHDNWPNFLVLNNGMVVSEPRNGLVGRMEMGGPEVYVNKDAFKKFLTSRQISEEEFIKPLEKDGFFIRSEKKRLAAGWRPMGGLATFVFKSDLVPDDLPNNAD